VKFHGNLFEPHIYFSELSTKLSFVGHNKDPCFVPHLGLDGHHQGDAIASRDYS
jgi:hypothetical protein